MNELEWPFSELKRESRGPGRVGGRSRTKGTLKFLGISPDLRRETSVAQHRRT